MAERETVTRAGLPQCTDHFSQKCLSLKYFYIFFPKYSEKQKLRHVHEVLTRMKRKGFWYVGKDAFIL